MIFQKPCRDMRSPLTFTKREVSSFRASICQALSPVKQLAPITIAPRGAYWDGGITDYHLHLRYLSGERDGIVLYPHFQKQVIPGWLDKAWRSRHHATSALDRMLVLAPDPQWVQTLPNAKLPDRNDFATYLSDNAGRVHQQARMWAGAWLIATIIGAALTTALDQWSWHLVDSTKDSGELLQMLLWFCWPAWPLALWTVWVWRRQIAAPTHYPHLSIALLFALLPVIACLSSLPADRALLLGLPAIATLAAFALPTFRRSISALIDWFTLLFFTAGAIVIWVVWLAFQTGYPPKIAANIARLAPQFEASVSWPVVIVALLATAGWFVLVAWRTSRNRAAIWKSLVLPASGATLGWVLLSTLWMAPLDHARSYEFQMQQLAQNMQQNHASGCMLTYGLGRAQIAAVRYYTNTDTALLRHSPPDSCNWALVDADRWAGDHNQKLRQGWREVSRITRLSGKKEVLILLQRSGATDKP